MPTCSTDNKHQPTIDNVFGKEWCMNLWRHEASHVGQKDDTHLDSSVNREEVGLTYVLRFFFLYNVRMQLTNSSCIVNNFSQ